MSIAKSSSRVAANTAPEVNARIRKTTEENVRRAVASGKEGIEQRIRELDSEWDVERCLETGAPSLILTGLLLGTTVDRKWLLLSGAVAGFLLQHALQGWCPPLPVFRRLGVRTAGEIDEERAALKALRGDFAHVSEAEESFATARSVADAALEAARH